MEISADQSMLALSNIGDPAAGSNLVRHFIENRLDVYK